MGRVLRRTWLANNAKACPLFIVAADDSQQMEGEKLAQGLRENGISLQGVDVLTSAKEAQLTAPKAVLRRNASASWPRPFVLAAIAPQMI